MNRILWISLVVGLSGCANRALEWDLDRPQDRAEDLVRALFALPDVDERFELEGPHALGSTVRVRVDKKGPGTIDGWSFETVPSDAGRVRILEQVDDRATLAIDLLVPGDVEVLALNRFGAQRDRVVFEVQEVASADLRAYADVKAAQPGILGNDGVLRIAEEGRASILITWRGPSGDVLTGRALAEFDLDVEDGVLSGEPEIYERDNLDALTLIAGRLPDPEPRAADTDTDAGDTDDSDAADTDAGDTDDTDVQEPSAPVDRTLRLFAGDAFVDEWTLRVLPVQAITGLTFDHDIVPAWEQDAREAEEYEPGSGDDRTIGWARARAVDADGARVLSPPTTWVDDGREVPGLGALVNLVLGGPSEVAVCVVGTEVCDDGLVDADLGIARRGVIGCFGCRAAGPGGALVVLGAVTLVAFRRRRGA